MKPVERQILGITSYGHCLCHMYALALPAILLSIKADFASSFTTVTAIGTVSYCLFGLGALPAGWLCARTNARFTLQLFFLISAAAALITGLVPSIWGFGIGLALLGVGLSLYHVSGLTLISQGIETKGKAMGIHGIAGSSGIMLAPLITGLIASAWHWRWVYTILCIPGLLGFVFLLIDRRIPRTTMIPPTAVWNPRIMPPGMVSLFVLAVIAMGLNGFIYRGFLTLFPTHLGEQITREGFTPEQVGGFLASIILGFGIIGQISGGLLSDRFRRTGLYFLIVCGTLPLLALVGYTSGYALIGIGVLFAIVHFAIQPVENHMISDFMPPRLVSYGFGIKFALTFGIGAFGAVFGGYIADTRSTAAVFPALAGFVVLVAIVVGILDVRSRGRTRPKS